MKKNSIFFNNKYYLCLLFLFHSCLFTNIYPQDAKPIFDGRLTLKPTLLNAAEEKIWFEKILPSAENYWKDSEELMNANNGEAPAMRDVTTGSFTKKGARQKAILYNFKNTGHNFSLNGIVIIENNNVVLHIIYNGGPDNSIGTLPDIDQNGLSELLIASSGQNSGELWKSVSIIQAAKKKIKKFGRLTVYTDNFGTYERKRKAEAVKLLVKKNNSPLFYKETYVSKDRDGGKNSWNKVDTMKQVKLDDDNTEYVFIK